MEGLEDNKDSREIEADVDHPTREAAKDVSELSGNFCCSFQIIIK